MKNKNNLQKIFAVASLSLTAVVVSATPIDLGSAGPGNWAILQTGNGNVSLANAANSGFVNGNIGVTGTGTVSDGGSLPISGNVYLGTSAGQSGLAGNVSGSVYQDAATQTMLNQAAADAATASGNLAALSSSGGGVGVTSISSGGTLNPGVYNLTSLQLGNNEHLILSGTSSDQFVFNISGSLTLNSAQITLLGAITAPSVVFNITGNSAVQFSGGLNNESVLYGIILALNSNVQVTPGAVIPEIISGHNINIASGGSVDGVTTVPDGGVTLALLGLGMTAMAFARRKFLN